MTDKVGIQTPYGRIWKNEVGKIILSDSQGFTYKITRARLYGIIEEMLATNNKGE